MRLTWKMVVDSGRRRSPMENCRRGGGGGGAGSPASRAAASASARVPAATAAA